MAHQGEQVGVGFDEDGLEAVLEEMAGAAMAVVEGDGEAGQQASHQRRQGHGTAAQEQANVVGQECPRQEAGVAAPEQRSKALQEVAAIGIVAEDRAPFDSTGHDVMQRTGCIEARTAGHAERIRVI